MTYRERVMTLEGQSSTEQATVIEKNIGLNHEPLCPYRVSGECTCGVADREMAEAEAEQTRLILGAAAVSIASRLKLMFPDAAKFDDEMIASALFLLADAGIIGFVGEDNETTKDVDLIGLKWLDPEVKDEDREHRG